ncbi:predicted protein [Micromonas commoda]|uniref:PDEase domain-containing protein n=1 Tax=Micromonas commoda (strain RCC299 / NOUM17 / CCMP2709) TaxID=296587 RepID=C1E004_MICCC|nr:predicted protein [Micromonas commoda]ACO61216.1 predicted protein [Micromonas commoda]|eukprot:XP_002499958.1 predicted protein [Micromonas commoda]
MAPAEGRADAATHDGSTIVGSGAVGAVLGDADAADVSDLDDSARLRRASSQDVGCSLPGAMTKAIPKRYATERTLATVRTTSPERKPSSPSQLARQSSFGPSTPPTHHLKQQLSVLRAEVSAHRLTHQGLRKVLNEATDLPRDSHAPAMDIIRRANSLLDYAESMIDENKGDTAGAAASGGDASSNWRASIPANAREFLSQYDHLGGEGIENNTFFHAVQMAKVAYESKIRREDTFNKGRPTPSKRSSLELMRSMSLSPTYSRSPDHPIIVAVDSWDGFDALGLAKDLRGGVDTHEGPSRVLVKTVQAVVDRHGLLDAFPRLDASEFREFLKDLEEGYNHPNDYHTATHAADVVQACGYFLSSGLRTQLTDVQAAAFVLAAAAHDVGHPGLNNAHLVNTEAPEAVRWNDVSVNENGHYHILRALLTKRGLLDAMFEKREERLAFLALLRRLILATDMENHTRLVADFLDIVQAANEAREARSAGGSEERGEVLSVGDLGDPELAMCFALHCADVSNPARPFEVCQRWGENVAEESYKQGDKERGLGMRVAAFCDRELSTPATTAQNQASFIDFVCRPLVEGLSTLLPEASEELLCHLTNNRERYGAIIAAANHNDE